MARELLHVGHDNGLRPLPGCPADAPSAGNPGAGHRSLEGTQDQFTRYNNSGTGTTLSYSYSGNRRSTFSYDVNGNVTSDATNSLQSSYNLINLPSQIKSGSTVKANYTYLSDGTKAAAYTSASAGKDYVGSFIYTRGSGGSKILESVAFGIADSDFGARLYDPALGRWLSQDPLAEKYYPHSPYLFCAGNPMNAVDKDGLFPIWPIIFALADYGMQVSDNYNQGLRGYDMLLGEINVAEVILSAVPVSKGSTIAQLGKTFAKEAFKAGIKYTPNDKFDVNENVSDVLSRAIISTTADAAVGRLLEFGSEAATTAAKKASEGAAKKAIHDANIAANRSRSTVRATRAETSQGVAHVARADYLERKIVNGTLVKAPELTKMAASTTAEKVYEIIDPLSVDKSGYFYLTGFGK